MAFPLVNRLRTELLALLRDVVPIVVVGVVTFHLMRTHLMQWYLVPTASMEPTLHGDPREGDVVLVDKTAYWSDAPQTWDLVVVRQRGGGLGGGLGGNSGSGSSSEDHIVKRLVCLAEDTQRYVSVRDGDVYAGDTRSQLELVRKHPVVNADMLVTWWQLAPAGGTGAGNARGGDSTSGDMLAGAGAWRSDGGGRRLHLAPAGADASTLAALAAKTVGEAPPEGHVGTRFPLDTSFVDGAGRRQALGFGLVRDGGAELQLRLAPGTNGVQLLLDQDAERFAFAWGDGDPHGIVRRDGQQIGRFAAPPLTGELHVRWGWLDGQLFLVVEDAVWWMERLELAPRALPTARPNGERGGRPGSGCRVHFAVSGSGAVSGPVSGSGAADAAAGAEVARLRVFHDVWYRGENEPFRREPICLEPGEMWLLGDNSFDSTDSRLRGAFARADLVGQPVAVLAPRSRMQLLRR